MAKKVFILSGAQTDFVRNIDREGSGMIARGGSAKTSVSLVVGV
jgi:hypothetical protein